jgi:translation initiation factor 5B
VLEVSKEKGMGTTIDIILYDGVINKDDLLVYGTSEGVEHTEIRALLEPKPLTEIRTDKHYSEVEKVEPAAGVKISAKDLKGVISGSPIRTCSREELEEAEAQVREELESSDYETYSHGVTVKADSLGSLEALMRELEEEEIMVQKAEVGPVNKSDVVQASNEEDEKRSIFAFNVGVTEQAEDMLEQKDVRLFQSKVIYEIIEGYTEWKEELQRAQREEKLENVTRPARIRLMPDHVFRSSDPAVAGTEVVEGVITPDARLMTPEGEYVGTVESLQKQNESINQASKGEEIATSISGATIGRNIEEGDVLITDITSEDYRTLKELEDLLSQGEKDLLKEIVEIKDEKNPHWKLS